MRPEDVLNSLREGNDRFASGAMVRHERVTDPAGGIPAHRPKAVVIACSDARVPPEAVFDQGPGEIFVVRCAGHVMEPASWASVWFAVEVVGAHTIVVLGHEGCAAVEAAMSSNTPDAFSAVIGPIRARTGHTDVTCAIEANVRVTVHEVKAHLREAIERLGGEVRIAGAICSLKTGKVEWLDE